MIVGEWKRGCTRGEGRKGGIGGQKSRIRRDTK